MAKNYLLLVASLLTRTNKLYYTGSDVVEVLDGIQTNVPVTKYVSALLLQSGEQLDKIITLCSKEVIEQKLPDFEGKTSIQVYKEDIIKNFSTRDVDFKDEDIKVLQFEIVNSEVEGVLNIIDQVVKETEEPNRERKLFIDFTGGLRTSSMALIFAARILQNQGFSIGGVFYANISRGKGLSADDPATIENCTKIYSSFDLLTGIAEVISGGNNQRLRDYGRKYGSTEINKVMKKAVEVLDVDKVSQLKKTEELKIDSIDKTLEKFIAETLKQEVEKDIWTDLLDKCKRRDTSVFSRLRNGPVELFSESGKLIYNGTQAQFDVVNELYALHRYYWNSYLPFAKNLLQAILDNPVDLPSTTYKKNTARMYRLSSYLSANHNTLTLNEFLRRSFEQNYPEGRGEIKSCASDLLENLKSRDSLTIDNLFEVIDEYNKRKTKLESMYFQMGFPFACAWSNGNRTSLYRDYDKWYKSSLERVLNALDKDFYSKKFLDIANTALKDAYMLEEMFPLIYNTSRFSSKVFVNPNGTTNSFEVSRFLTKALPALDEIRLMRNQIQHNMGNPSPEIVEKYFEAAENFILTLRPK